MTMMLLLLCHVGLSWFAVEVVPSALLLIALTSLGQRRKRAARRRAGARRKLRRSLSRHLDCCLFVVVEGVVEITED
jgi:hypothetical protein